MSTIASLGTISDSLDTAAKLLRVLDKEEVTLDQLLLPVNDRAARRRLAAFFKAGCQTDQKKDLPAQPPAKMLLERLPGTIALPVVAQFSAAEKFRPGETIDDIKVAWLGDNFKEHLLPKCEKNEVAAEELAVNKLLENSRDPAIITALGGEEKVEISLGQFWEFLKTANQKFWYVAYIRDTDGVLWAVSALWDSGGLGVGAHSLDRPDEWGADGRFLSR